MTANPPTIHGVPVDAAGRHVASPSCPCRPVLCADLLEPARIVYAHRHAPDVPDVPPDALLWRSREARAVGHDTSPVPPQRGRGDPTGSRPPQPDSPTRRPDTRVPFCTHPMGGSKREDV
jgi:hypothetical protein